MERLDHKQVIVALTSDQRRHLIARSDLYGLRHLAIYALSMAVTTALILGSDSWRPVFMLVQGILICFLFTLLHETVHRTPFRSRSLNDQVGRVCGLLIFLEPGWFRSFHLAHHRYTNEPDRDPELFEPRPSTMFQYLKYISGLPETIDRLRLLVRNATRSNTDSFISDEAAAGVMRRARVQLSFYAALIALSLALSSALLVTIWLLPFVMAGPFLRAYLLAEHAGCPDSQSMFANTRTVFTNPIVRFVAWNMPYHVEHHAFPAVPFHKLAAFHEYTKDHLLVTDPGYFRFNRDFAANMSHRAP